MKHRLFLSAALLAMAGNAEAAIVYNQPPTHVGGGIASQNDTNGLGNIATAYDNFTLGGSAAITSVEFSGAYSNPPVAGTITGFNLQFYADNAGQPGASIYSTSVVGNANETFAGNFGGFPNFTYSIATNFSAAAGVQYWLSVVPDLGFPPQWLWAEGSGGDGISYQDFAHTRSLIREDSAFALIVPEPASLTLLGVWLAALGLIRRRG